MKRLYAWAFLSLTLPMTLFGIVASPKAMGRGFTTQATPLDTLSAAYNPAVMGLLPQRFDVAFTVKRVEGTTNISDNLFISDSTFDNHKENDFYFPNFGVNVRDCQCNLSVGLIYYNRTQFKTTYKEAISILGDTPPSLEYRQDTLAPSIAISFGNNHALGITADIIAHRIKIDGIENFATTFFTNLPDNFTNLGYDYAYGIGGTIGWISYLNECVSFGASYQPEIEMRAFDKYQGFLAHQGRINIPERIAGGIAVQVLPNILFAFDVEHLRWREIPAFTNPGKDAIDEIYAGDLTRLFGEDLGPGFGFGNRLFFRLGLEAYLNSFWQIRCGYEHARASTKPEETYLNILTSQVVEELITFGLSYWPCINHELTCFIAHGIKHKVNGVDSIPLGAIGEGFLIGGGNCALESHYDLVGISWGKEF